MKKARLEKIAFKLVYELKLAFKQRRYSELDLHMIAKPNYMLVSTWS